MRRRGAQPADDQAPACGPDGGPADSAPGGIFDEVRNMPGHLLRRFHQIAVGVFLKECADFDLTPVQFSILATLAQTSPLDQIRLSGFAALDRTTISVVVRRLESRGLVARNISARDRRSKMISITPRGLELMHEILPRVRQIQDILLAPLAPGERETFRALLQKAVEANNQNSRVPLRGQ
ncbi:MAG TPA: MarR family transcriptional regulator [Hyphomicrobiales bacterium]|nr:MarR family transcriptional regulator [Rhodobiaceae bacterium]HXK54277.1 MarR family transcriptional regulator [Hyphomicrobiales bacterium]